MMVWAVVVMVVVMAWQFIEGYHYRPICPKFVGEGCCTLISNEFPFFHSSNSADF